MFCTVCGAATAQEAACKASATEAAEDTCADDAALPAGTAAEDTSCEDTGAEEAAALLLEETCPAVLQPAATHMANAVYKMDRNCFFIITLSCSKFICLLPV
jgi:hypothetical protein